MDNATARKLAERVIGTGHKGYLIIVFPENDPNPNPMDVSFGTNAEDNGVLVNVCETVLEMILNGSYKQEILGDDKPQLPPSMRLIE
jgi:hypothetical protein